MTTNTGGLAFANVISIDCVRVEMDGSAEYEPKAQPGNVTVRDYFAAKALQGALANPNFKPSEGTMANLSRHCYAQADAMLKARES